MVDDLTFGSLLDAPFQGDAQDFSGNSNDGSVTGADLVVDEDNRFEAAYDFVSGNSDKINFGNVGNIKTIALRINLDSTTESIVEESAAAGISVSGGSLSYATWDNAFVDGVDTDTIATGWTTLIVTSTTDVAATALQLGLIDSTYGDFKCSFIKTWDRALSVIEIKQVSSNISHNYQGLFDGMIAAYDFRGDAKDFSGNENDGVITGADPIVDEFNIETNAYDFISGNSDKIAFGNIGNTKTIIMRINLDSTTEDIFEQSAAAGISCSGGTLSYAAWDNAFVDGVDTDTIATGWTTLAITSSTDVAVSAGQLGLIDSTYGDLKCSFLAFFDTELSSGTINGIHQMLKSGDFYPYPQERQGGIQQ